MSLLTLWLMYLGALVSPGPNQLLVVQLAASQRRGPAWWAGMGVAAAAGLWATSALLGLGGLMQAQPWLRQGLMLFGIAYLLWLALRLWRAGAPTEAGTQAEPPRPAAAFRLGLLTNLSNPKAALFFASLFAAHLPPQPGLAWAGAAVAGVVVCAVAWYTLLALLLTRPGVQALYVRAGRGINRAVALLFALMALKLASSF